MAVQKVLLTENASIRRRRSEIPLSRRLAAEFGSRWSSPRVRHEGWVTLLRDRTFAPAGRSRTVPDEDFRRPPGARTLITWCDVNGRSAWLDRPAAVSGYLTWKP
ncbi:predicted protein [Streptomyces viridosporus ATCC 14672]|uniref:Predicted protein n=1 Tax=Streptomyces viridosporus (strain ATCC 14672 / DSM 40746 / JCM 4963 / KCTC 9882 / NRRL B-12104 / FH 1290) TaxID=566461 RepID=D5ZNT8_STRV1|nr:predicted protein [Streptomyces viridosporus ATCC 14672]